MKSIQVNSLPLKEVIEDLATIFSTKFYENCGEYILEIPENIGEGVIRGINFEDGLGLLHYDCLFKEDMEIHFIINNVHPLKFLYVEAGVLYHRFEDEDTEHEIEQFQDAIVASSKHNGHVLSFKANHKTKINSLEIDREKFQRKMECDIQSLDETLEKLFRDINAKEAFYHKGNYSLGIADLLQNMEEFTAENFIRKIFLEGMANQILTEQILQYQDDQRDEGSRMLLRSSEIKQVRYIAGLIENKIAEIPTVESMAKDAGLNINKLQTGFKKLYGTTVNNYVQKVRLDMAKSLLMGTEFSISEIVTTIGLSSKSYFSKIFKEKYDISPSDFRNNYRKNL
ncbi:helix-turn-helix transcriptional regulator [Aequorivita echinoideorum]|uniref:AraC family transcriptional regulator n=1 Tax=Aequorivita echinoideorum TaxID=1549647 RepID=A0ABS5S4I8_9FLAO|nr:AraC family transcriptional regulator [Aequorivita echinoideorum]MBT0608126.1 AraC family transcriptional regulator [Aequorivita echinoideorum]